MSDIESEAEKHSESHIRQIMANIRQEHMDLYFGEGSLSREERIRDEVRLYCKDRDRLAAAWGNASDATRQIPELVCDVLKMFHQGITMGSMMRHRGSPSHFTPVDETYHRSWQVYSLLPQEIKNNYEVIKAYVGQGGSIQLVSKTLLKEQDLRKLTHLSEHISILTEEFAEAMTNRLGRQKVEHRGQSGWYHDEAPDVSFEEVCSLDLWEKFQRPQLGLQVDLSQDPPLLGTFGGGLPDKRTAYPQNEITALTQHERKKHKSLAAALKKSIRRRLKSVRKSQMKLKPTF